MLIFVAKLNGNGFVYQVEPTDTVFRVKRYIQRKEGIPASEQCLVYLDKELEDRKTLSDYDVKDRSILHQTGKQPDVDPEL